jgi:hypothetical protein
MAHCRDGGRPSWRPVVGVLPPLWHQGHNGQPTPRTPLGVTARSAPASAPGCVEFLAPACRRRLMICSTSRATSGTMSWVQETSEADASGTLRPGDRPPGPRTMFTAANSVQERPTDRALGGDRRTRIEAGDDQYGRSVACRDHMQGGDSGGIKLVRAGCTNKL